MIVCIVASTVISKIDDTKEADDAQVEAELLKSRQDIIMVIKSYH